MNKFILILLWLGSMMLAQATTIENYQPYLQPGLDKARLQLADIEPLIKQYAADPALKVTELGR